MELTRGVLGRSNVNTTDYEPLEIHGQPHGEVHWVRNEELERGPYRAAIWRLTDDHLPYESPYEFRCDETVCILEGEVEITFADGETLLLAEGDVISVARGTRSQWKITKPFKKLVVET